MRAICGLLAAALVFSISTAEAAVISISSVDAVDSPDYDLTATYGTADWAYWNSTANPASGTPGNEKLGGTLIGDMSAVGGGNVRGTTSGNRPIYDFVFSDGAVTSETSPASNLIGLFNTQLNTSGAGVHVDVTSPTDGPFTIYVWGTAYRSIGTLTASVGTESASDSSLNQDGRNPGRFYTILVDPDNAGQVVSLTMTLTSGSDTNSNVSLAGIAVTFVPEPGALALLLSGGLAILGLGWYRRRRR